MFKSFGCADFIPSLKLSSSRCARQCVLTKCGLVSLSKTPNPDLQPEIQMKFFFIEIAHLNHLLGHQLNKLM